MDYVSVWIQKNFLFYLLLLTQKKGSKEKGAFTRNFLAKLKIALKISRQLYLLPEFRSFWTHILRKRLK